MWSEGEKWTKSLVIDMTLGSKHMKILKFPAPHSLRVAY